MVTGDRKGLKNCDLIIVLDKGQIVEKGTHEELVENQGLYYRLWEMQQGNYKIQEELIVSDEALVENVTEDVITYS